MHFILYKTTNLINGKFYVGIHRTNDLNDNYLGSGKNLKIAISKYGRENFKREILKECSSYEELLVEEKIIVTEDFCKRRDTYNQEIGGSGGKIWNDELRKKMSKSKKGSIPWNKGKSTGSFLTNEGKTKLRLRMSGANNHMHGVNVASIMTKKANKERLAKISKANRKPKKETAAYKNYASKRIWIVNKRGVISHTTDLNDARLVTGEFKLGMIWK